MKVSNFEVVIYCRSYGWEMYLPPTDNLNRTTVWVNGEVVWPHPDGEETEVCLHRGDHIAVTIPSGRLEGVVTAKLVNVYQEGDDIRVILRSGDYVTMTPPSARSDGTIVVNPRSGFILTGAAWEGRRGGLLHGLCGAFEWEARFSGQEEVVTSIAPEPITWSLYDQVMCLANTVTSGAEAVQALARELVAACLRHQPEPGADEG